MNSDQSGSETQRQTVSSGELSDPCTILYVVTSSLSLPFLRNQIRYLTDRGALVSVATRLDEDASNSLEPPTQLHNISFEREPSFTNDVRALCQLLRLIRRLRPMAVNAATPKAGLLAMVAASIYRVPRRVYVVWGLRFETTSGWRRQVLRALERFATWCATDVLYNSQSLREVAIQNRAVSARRAGLLGSGGSGNCVCHSRFDTLPEASDARRRLGLPPEVGVVGFVGRLTVDKGIVDLVSLFEKNPIDAELLLVGQFETGDPLPEHTHRTIEQNPRIHHVSWMSDTRSAYSAMDVLAFPSYREGLPNVPMEAQRSGVPVVAYAATGTVDTVESGQGGFLVPVGNISELKGQIECLIHDPALRLQVGSAARAFAEEHFDPVSCWRHLNALLTTPAGSPAARWTDAHFSKSRRR